MSQRKNTKTVKAKPAETEFSLTVSRALGILSMFSPTRPQLGLAEISRDTKLSKPSVLRFMQALLIHGYVEQDPQTKKYRPGFETFRIGSLVGGWGLRTIAQPIMRAVTDETGFTSYVSVLRSDKMVVLASVEGRGPLRFTVPVGEMFPAASTSSGHAALSVFDDAAVTELIKISKLTRKSAAAPATIGQLRDRLREVRAQKFAVSWEMTSPGVGSVSSAVIDADGKLAAVLTLGFATGQVEKSEIHRLGAKIRTAAQNLSSVLQNSANLRAA